MEQLLSEHGEYYPHCLAQRFPHILHRLIAYWGAPEMEPYLESLLAPPQPGAKGFPTDAIFEVISIKPVQRHKLSIQQPEATQETTPEEHMEAPPEVVRTSLPANRSEDDEHEAAMVFDRIHRW